MEMHMHDKLKSLLLASAALILLSGTVSAQTSGTGATGAAPQTAPIPPVPPSKGATPSASTGTAAAISSTTETAVVGVKVESRDNKSVGTVSNVVVTPDGKVDKLIVAVGGVLGLGAKDVAVNWEQMKMDSEQRVARLDLTESELDGAPAYRGSDSAVRRPAVPPAAPLGGTTTPPAIPQQQ
jgi:hypothetical protein